jgi:hypothetical protein
MEDLISYNSKFITANARLDAGEYKGIVNRVRRLYRRTSPYGCAQNIKAEVRDIDKAVESNRLRERMVDEFAENELQKLNLFKVSTQKFGNPINTNRKQGNYKKKLNITFEKPKNETFCASRFSKTQSATRARPNFSPRSSVRPNTGQITKSNITKNYDQSNTLKMKRLASLESIMKSCDELHPKIKPQIDLIINQSQSITDTSNHIAEYITDLEDCIKLTHDGKKLEGLMKICRNSRKFNKAQSIQPGMKDEMLNVTMKILQLGRYKLWRHNHAEFMASAEKKIYSVSKKRS